MNVIGESTMVIRNGLYRFGVSFLEGSMVIRFAMESHTLSPIFHGEYFCWHNLSAIHYMCHIPRSRSRLIMLSSPDF